MKTTLFFTLFLSLNLMAQVAPSQGEKSKKVQMDYGDKQLLKRDSCRKPMEALETKYGHLPKEELAKMKSKCDY